jgi:hypothetical protein
LAAISAFWAQHVKIPLRQYVCDFSIDAATLEVKCIELNPWAPNTSSALFDWPELMTIEATSAETAFRYLSSPLPDAAARISPFWRALIAISRAEDAQSTQVAQRIVATKRVKRVGKYAKRKAKALAFDWVDTALPLLLIVKKRGFVTDSDLLCLGWRVLISSHGSSNFAVPSASFLLWCASVQAPLQHQVAIRDASWSCAEYLASCCPDEVDLDNILHNQAVWLGRNLKGE